MPLVLVVDDDLAMQMLMARLVESSGHEVMIADNGIRGLEVFIRRAPDLVITDLSMPGGEGGALIGEIRCRAPHTKILAVSGGLIETDADRAGADAVLGKPFRARAFCDAVAGLVAAEPATSY
jgi:CheY-like chemotaxis protein